MPDLGTDHQWDLWGQQQPYFGVLVSPDYRDVVPGGAAWQEFMATGEAHVAELFERLGHMGAPTRYECALDFGCGVGRLLGPLARRCDEVVGVDVSAAMRAEAQANLALQEVGNASVVASDDLLSAVTGTFDLVHSYNVLQHIAPRRGLAITRRLLDVTRPGGTVVLHYCDRARALRHRVKRVAGGSQVLVRAAKRLRGADTNTPIMQMFEYRFRDVAGLLQEHGVEDVRVQLATFHRNTFFQVHAVLPE